MGVPPPSASAGSSAVIPPPAAARLPAADATADGKLDRAPVSPGATLKTPPRPLPAVERVVAPAGLAPEVIAAEYRAQATLSECAVYLAGHHELSLGVMAETEEGHKDLVRAAGLRVKAVAEELKAKEFPNENARTLAMAEALRNEADQVAGKNLEAFGRRDDQKQWYCDEATVLRMKAIELTVLAAGPLPSHVAENSAMISAVRREMRELEDGAEQSKLSKGEQSRLVALRGTNADQKEYAEFSALMARQARHLNSRLEVVRLEAEAARLETSGWDYAELADEEEAADRAANKASTAKKAVTMAQTAVDTARNELKEAEKRGDTGRIASAKAELHRAAAILDKRTAQADTAAGLAKQAAKRAAASRTALTGSRSTTL
jgi:hypothetical protein